MPDPAAHPPAPALEGPPGRPDPPPDRLRLHLSPKHHALLDALLRKHVPRVEVWAYGSRVSGESHDGSDLDLVLRGPGLEEVPIGDLCDLEDALRASNLPFLVETHDWARLPREFHPEIERRHVVLRRPDRDDRPEGPDEKACATITEHPNLHAMTDDRHDGADDRGADAHPDPQRASNRQSADGGSES